MRFTVPLCILFLAIGFYAGWKFHQHKMVTVPTGDARLEIPIGCSARKWMNGIETDCPKGVTSIYYVEKLKQASPR